jgi:DNA-binding NarL/FixJ family response regulator
MKLTPRFYDQQIIACIAEGLTNKEISSSIGLPIRSVRWRVEEIKRRAGLARGDDSKRKMVVLAVRGQLS